MHLSGQMRPTDRSGCRTHGSRQRRLRPPAAPSAASPNPGSPFPPATHRHRLHVGWRPDTHIPGERHTSNYCYLILSLQHGHTTRMRHAYDTHAPLPQGRPPPQQSNKDLWRPRRVWTDLAHLENLKESTTVKDGTGATPGCPQICRRRSPNSTLTCMRPPLSQKNCHV